MDHVPGLPLFRECAAALLANSAFLRCCCELTWVPRVCCSRPTSQVFVWVPAALDRETTDSSANQQLGGAIIAAAN